ncbi:MAG: hypothetical protein WDW36_007310 [Sanguina aurantia]
MLGTEGSQQPFTLPAYPYYDSLNTTSEGGEEYYDSSVNAAGADGAAAWSVQHDDPGSHTPYDEQPYPEPYGSPSPSGAPARHGYGDEYDNSIEYHEMHVEHHPRLDYVNCVEDGSGRVRINGGCAEGCGPT